MKASKKIKKKWIRITEEVEKIHQNKNLTTFRIKKGPRVKSKSHINIKGIDYYFASNQQCYVFTCMDWYEGYCEWHGDAYMCEGFEGNLKNYRKWIKELELKRKKGEATEDDIYQLKKYKDGIKEVKPIRQAEKLWIKREEKRKARIVIKRKRKRAAKFEAKKQGINKMAWEI